MTQSLKRWLSGPIGWGRTLLLLVAAAGGVALAVAGWDDWSVSRQCDTWRKTPCDIETCNIVREAGRDDRNMPGWQYVPVVVYRYEVNGEPHSGTVVSSRTSPLTKPEAAEAFQQRFGPGARAECYVNPDDPTEAMLELPTNAQAKRVAKFGGLALGLALVSLLSLEVMLSFGSAPRKPGPRAPGWGEIDSAPDDPLRRTRELLREKLES